MIFTRTKRAADRVAEDLDFRGFAVAAVHGDLGQGARERALRAFRTGKIDVLVATDVAARGLDVSGVTHVINYDCPEDPDTYTHRIGRTGRAGATGVAVTFVDWEDMPRWVLIDKSMGLEHAAAAGDLPHLAGALRRPGHPDRHLRHPADRRAHPRRPVRRDRGGPGRHPPARPQRPRRPRSAAAAASGDRDSRGRSARAVAQPLPPRSATSPAAEPAAPRAAGTRLGGDRRPPAPAASSPHGAGRDRRGYDDRSSIRARPPTASAAAPARSSAPTA